jgi:4-aminobutyrate aminotransferase
VLRALPRRARGARCSSAPSTLSAWAAIFVEPIQGEGGYVVPAKGFLERLRAICDKYDILLVFDEVQAGFGRTGKFFACEHFGVEPDIICMAKGIASGMPLGAIMAREHIMDWPYGAHASTFGGNPVSCAAGLATMDLLEGKLVKNAEKIGKAVLEATKGWTKKHEIVGEVRGKGLMIGIEIIQRGEGNRPAPTLRNEIIEKCFERGLLILGCGANNLRFCPPLVINEKQALWAMQQIEEIIEEVAQPSNRSDADQAEDHTPLTAKRRVQGKGEVASMRPGARGYSPTEKRVIKDRRTAPRVNGGRRDADGKTGKSAKAPKAKAAKKK